MIDMAKNVFGTELKPCNMDPVTGFFRDGSCNTSDEDYGSHTVCAIMTEEFLRFSFDQGNDLITPRPEYQFEGLGPGNHWCLCAARWLEAYEAGAAPLVDLEATHERALEIISFKDLIRFAYRIAEE
jgi:uncharacterized protein (DUF2237 family)